MMDRAVLEARELRWRLRRELVQIHGRAIVSVTLRAPQALRTSESFRIVHRELCKRLRAFIKGEGTDLDPILETVDAEGPCAYFAACDAEQVKALCIRFEDGQPGGELLDADVMNVAGEALHRGRVSGQGRRCAVCGRAPALECILSRTHPTQETEAAFERLAAGIPSGADAVAKRIAQAALRAVLYELAVTPKPGLVDRQGTGSHTDMGFFTFLDGASALAPYFLACTRTGVAHSGRPDQLLKELRPLGIRAEQEMLRATSGLNTHKGTVFSMGILCASAGYLAGRGLPLATEEVCRLAGEIAAPALSDFGQEHLTPTHGLTAFRALGVHGARGEAAAGFPSVQRHALPVLRGLLRAGRDVDAAGTSALLSLMAHVEDTNVLHRAGLKGLYVLRREASRLLSEGFDANSLARFGRLLEDENISPGGCADLLALAFFLYFLECFD